MAFRLQALGWKAYRVGGAIAYHERGLAGEEKASDFNIALKRRNKSEIEQYFSYRNHLYVLIKNLSLGDVRRYGIYILWYELKKIIFIIIFERHTLYAWVEVVNNCFHLLKQRRHIQPRSAGQWINKI